MTTEIEKDDATNNANEAKSLDDTHLLPKESDADEGGCRGAACGPYRICDPHV